MKKLEGNECISRPWGGYAIVKKTKTHWIKKLFVHRNARLSLQSHLYRDEVWFVLKGKVIAQVGKHQTALGPNQFLFIPRKKKHRLIGVTNACVVEIAFGMVLERDIIRYEDDYGRV